MSNEHEVIKATRQWLESVVLALNLCPFAHRVWREDTLRYKVSAARTEAQLLADVEAELTWLQATPETETSLLIHPAALSEFEDYNQFLGLADVLLGQLRLHGVIQIASFHPGYCFAGSAADDAENYTNRTPYPMLHLLRESSVSRAVAEYPDVDDIPQRNIERLQHLGTDTLRALLEACHSGS